MGPRRRKERERSREHFEDIIAENFPNLEEEIDVQVQETRRAPNRPNPKRNTSRRIVIKMAKIKEQILKAVRG